MTVKLILIILSSFISALIINYFADILPLSQMYIKPRIWLRSHNPKNIHKQRERYPIRSFKRIQRNDNTRLEKPPFGVPHCHQCQTPQKWRVYLFHMKCAVCETKPKNRRWGVLIVFPLLIIIAFFLPNERINFGITYLLLFYFSIIFIIDMEYRIILTSVNLLGYIIGAAIGSQLHGWLLTLLGGISGFLIMLGLHYFGIIFSKILSKRKNRPIEEVSLGFGDVILAGTVGLLLGWPGVTAGLFLSIVLGGLFSGGYLIYHLVRKAYQPFSAIPYAPFIIISTMWLLLR
jgi:leader peptidase (prepilin peptidase)/N-methyltransferase